MLNFRNLKLWFLITVTYFSRNLKAFAFGAAVFLLLIFLQLHIHLINFQSGVSEGFIGTFEEHDLPQEVTRLLSSSLVEPNKAGRVHSQLASGWQANRDATVFTFKLKDNLRWSDGSLIKSADLDFPIPDVEVSYPDEKTILFKLKESYSPFPTLLTHPVFKKGTLIGTGPYRLAKLEKSRIFITKLVLEPEKQNLPQLAIRFYPNEKTAKTGFEEGEIQSLLGSMDPSSLLSNSLVGLKEKTDYAKVITVLYNTKDPLLSSRSVRQALSFAVPQTKKEVIANNPISIWSWAYGGDIKDYLDNPEEARAAEKRAKSAVSNDLLHREILLTSTPYLQGVGKEIVAAWRKIGFDAKLRVESGVPQNFHALLITQRIPLDPDQYSLWHSTQSKTNLTGYASARVDKDLEDGRKLIREEDRKSKYTDFQKALLEDAPAAFLYYPKYKIVYLKKISSKLDRVLSLQFGSQYD